MNTLNTYCQIEPHYLEPEFRRNYGSVSDELNELNESDMYVYLCETGADIIYLDWLLLYGSDPTTFYDIFMEVIEWDQWDTFRYLCDNRYHPTIKQKISRDGTYEHVYNHIAMSGKINYMRYLCNSADESDDVSLVGACYTTIRYGHVDILRYLINKHKLDSMFFCDIAAQYGQLDCLRYLYRKGFPITKRTYLVATTECKFYIRSLQHIFIPFNRT